MNTSFVYMRIFTNLQRFPDRFSPPSDFIKKLPYDLDVFPLRDASPQETVEYVYDSMETLYISVNHDFERFLEKLSFLLRYSPWQPDAEMPGPFRKILWRDNYIRSGSAYELLSDFSAWDKDFRELSDSIFYRVFCSLRKALSRAASGLANKINLAEIYVESSHISKSNSIVFPFGEGGPDFGEEEERAKISHVPLHTYVDTYGDSSEI